MKHLLDKIIAQKAFSYEDSKSLIYQIENEEISDSVLASILTGFQIKGIEIQEIMGFRDALLELCPKVDIDSTEAIDLCGTGGDGKNTFNISTTTALVMAAMGKKVIKHGNYGVSSLSGSSNVLETIGFSFETESSRLQESLDNKNFCFIHAPLFHPTLKKAANVRKQLGVRTIFNCLGPLVNPVQPKYQLTGTYSLELAKTYQYVLKNERTNFRVVYGMDGCDEITLTDSTRILGKNEDLIISAKTFNIAPHSMGQITGGTSVNQSAKILINILKGNGSEVHNSTIAANVASGLHLYSSNVNLVDLFNESLMFIKSGQTAKHFNL